MKIIAEKLDNKFTVKVQLSVGESVNKFDYGIVSTGTYNALSRVSQIQFDDEKTLVYHASSDKCLEEWLSEKHSEFDFTSILSSMLRTFVDAIDGGLSTENFLFDCKYIFVNDKNKTIEFVYLPINGYKSVTSPYQFISDFIKKIEFQSGEAPDYILELNSLAQKKEISFIKFREKIDQICGKSIREEIKVKFDSDDEDTNKKIKKKDEIYLREIPGGTNAIPLQKKVKTQLTQVNSNAGSKIQQAQPIRQSYDSIDMVAHSSVKNTQKKEMENNNQVNDEDKYAKGGFAIPNISAPQKKNKRNKKEEKSKKAGQAIAVTPAMGSFAIPTANADMEKDDSFNIPGESTNVSNLAKEKKESEGHGFNLTEMLVNFIKKLKAKKKEQEVELKTKEDNKKETAKKKNNSDNYKFEVPNINSDNENKGVMAEELNSKRQSVNNSDDAPDLDVQKNDNEQYKGIDKRNLKEEMLLETERAKFEKEKAEHEAKIKELDEAKRIESEKQRKAREDAEREAEEKRKVEEERLSAERKKIAKEREAQQKEAMLISEEKKKIEAERAKLEKEIEEKMRVEQEKSEKSPSKNEEKIKSDALKASKKDMDNVLDNGLFKIIKPYEQVPAEKKYSEDDPTVLLPNNNYVAYLYPKLLRKKTNETVYISKSAFRIGKEKSNVDYCVSRNSAISRLHAIIYCKEGRYFIVDTLSTNHTFVNGKIITSNQNYELLSGDIITLANEDFEFSV